MSDNTRRPAIFYDSLCPVCDFEIKLLKKKDKRGVIDFIDITNENFNPELYGKSIEDFIGSIHGLDKKGSLINGIDVFVEIYQALGMGWVYSWTRLPVVRPIIDFAYKIFAIIRPKLSGFQPACAINEKSKRCR